MQTKKIVATLLATIMLLLPGISRAGTFIDVPAEHFSYEAIELLSKMKVIKGFSTADGKSEFRPDNAVTRVEALKIVMEGAKLAVPELAATETFKEFTDIADGSWYLRYIKKAKELGVVKGNPDGTFAPGRSVNKVELLKMIITANKLDVSTAADMDLPYVDVDTNSWYVPFMKYGVQYNLIYPTPTGKLEPGKNLSRAEVAEMVYRLILIQKNGELQSLLSQSESFLVQSLQYISMKEYNQAKTYADKAILFTEKALAINSEKSIVKAANKVSLALSKVSDAFIAQTKGEHDLMKQLVEEAKTLAQEAKDSEARVVTLTDQIMNLAEILSTQ